MVNESFVRHYLAKVDPLTQRIPTRPGSDFARSRRSVRSERHKRTSLLETPRNGSTSNAAGVTTSGKVEILSYFADQVRPETRADELLDSKWTAPKCSTRTHAWGAPEHEDSLRHPASK